MDVSIAVLLVIVFALVFDFTNGFHDTANAMATSVATGALRPRTAVLIAAILNVVGAFLSTEVAKTISGGIINTDSSGSEMITPVLIFAGLVGAILWNLATWWLGLPSSSSHALFGGLIGAALIGAGIGAVDFSTVLSKIVIPALLSPLIAGVAAMLASFLAYTLTRNDTMPGSNRGFRTAQTVSASLVALAHGTSDAQKTMGVITLTLITANVQPAGSGPQLWVILACGLAIGLGTYSGGWRIMKTMGKKLVDVEPPQGFAAETASTATILASSHLGFALSTTQVVSGAVVGAGVGKKLAAVRWGVAGRIAVAWLFTLPAAAVVGGIAALLASSSTAGLIIMVVLAVAAIVGIAALARRKPVTAATVNDDEDEMEKVAA